MLRGWRQRRCACACACAVCGVRSSLCGRDGDAKARRLHP